MNRRALTQYALLAGFFLAPLLIANFGPRYVPLGVEVYIAVLVISVLFGTAAAGFWILAVVSIIRRRGRSVSAEYMRLEYRYIGWSALFATLTFTGALASNFTPLAPVYAALVLAYVLSVVPPSARYLEYRAATVVHCTPEEAFDFVTDPRNVSLYFPQIELVPPVDLPLQAGATIRYRVRQGSMVLEDDEKVTEIEPNRTYATESSGADKGIYMVKPVDGGTELAYVSMVMLPLAQAAIGGGLLTRRMQLKHLLSRREEALRRIKETLEAPAPLSV